MKTRLLKKLRKRAKKEYYIEIQYSEYEWNIKLIHKKIIGTWTYENEITSYYGHRVNSDEYSKKIKYLREECDTFRRILVKDCIDDLKKKRLRTKIIY